MNSQFILCVSFLSFTGVNGVNADSSVMGMS